MSVLRRVSFVPFEIGCSVTRDRVESLSKSLARSMPGVTVSTSEWAERLLPRGAHALEIKESTRVVLDPTGFGLILYEVDLDVESIEAEAVTDAIMARRDFHGAVCQGEHELAALCQLVREASLMQLSRRDRGRARPNLWSHPPYVLSIYFLHINKEPSSDMTTDLRRCIASLLEPTRVEETTRDGPLETQRMRLSKAIREFPSVSHVTQEASIDHSVDTLALASWAGLVVACAGASPHRQRQYESVEIRAQLTWSIAHYLRQWAGSVVDGDDADIAALTAFETGALPRLRNLANLSTGTTRQAGIFRAVSETSELDREIDTAEATLRLAHLAHDHRRAESRRRAERAIEILLAFLALSQVLPLVTKQPMIEAPDWLIALGVATVVSLFVRWQWRRG